MAITCDVCGTNKTAGPWTILAALLLFREDQGTIIASRGEEYEHLCHDCIFEIRKNAIDFADELKAGIKNGDYVPREAGSFGFKKQK